MRQIKFRAWDAEKSRMYYPGDGTTDVVHFRYQPSGALAYAAVGEQWDSGIEGYGFVPGETLTLAEFTGLTDKNGVEIYEGDILRAEFTQPVRNLRVEHSCAWDLARCQRDEMLFMSAWGATDGQYYYTFCNVYDPGRYAEVIGNIYQNPELLP